MTSASASRDEQRRHRRCWAACALLLWLLGFEIGPDLHLAVHDQLAAHVHGLDHRDEHEHEHEHHHQHADHDHAGEVHEHEARGHASHHLPSRADADRSSEDGASATDPFHGRHAASHRGLALLAPGLADPEIARAPWRLVAPRPSSFTHRSETLPKNLRARGPPLQALARS